MFAVVLLGLFLLLAVASMLGLTADSRDLRPQLPVHAPGDQPETPSTEQFVNTALPPYPRTPLVMGAEPKPSGGNLPLSPRSSADRAAAF